MTDDVDGAAVAIPNHERALHERLDRIERLLSPRHLVEEAEHGVDICLPAWRRVTKGEHRAVATATILIAIGLMVALPSRVANRPRWILPGLALLLLVGLVAANPSRLERESRRLRAASLKNKSVWSQPRTADHAGRLLSDQAAVASRAEVDTVPNILTAFSLGNTRTGARA